MISDDEARVWSLIAARARARHAPMAVPDACAACAVAVAVGGVGVSLETSGRLEPVYASGVLGHDLLDAAMTSGDGPCLDAMASGGPVAAADLDAPASARRWPFFTAAALSAGVRSAFAFPLITGAVRVGVLVLCRDRRGALTSAEQSDALIFADATLTLLLSERAGRADEPLPADSLALGPEIHQAAGMVSVQLVCDVEQALARLRAHAFANDISLAQVAAAVVARTLRFAPDSASN